MDVKEPDFKKVMNRYFDPNQLAGSKISLATTQPGMMNQLQSVGRPTEGDKNRAPYEIAPAKNAVSLEEQMMNESKTAIDYQLVTNIYQKQVGMLRTAIGR
jgi:flagellar basal-body rod protein FlgB